MDAVPIHFHPLHDLLHLAVHAYMHEAFLADRLEKLLVMTLTAAHHRSQEQDLLSCVFANDEVDDLLVGELDHRLAGQVRIGDTRAGIEQSQEIIHLCHRTYRRARVLARRLLVDGDDRTQARYLIHVRTLHLTDEPAGIRGEGLHVTPLTLSEDRIESQGRLTRPAEAGDHCQFFPRDRHADILQVVHPSPDHFDMSFVLCHSLFTFAAAKVRKKNDIRKQTKKNRPFWAIFLGSTQCLIQE